MEATGQQVIDGAEQPVVYGYRANVIDIPDRYAVTASEQGGDASRDSDLDSSNTRLVPDAPVDGLIVLASEEMPGELPEALIDGPDGKKWSVKGVESSEANDAGLVPYAKARIGGWVWTDSDADGIQQDDDVLVPGAEVVLERRLGDAEEAHGLGAGSRIADGAPGSGLDGSGEPLKPASRTWPSGGSSISPEIGDDGVWEAAGSAFTGIDGGYLFDDLELVDEAGRPWQYRVRTSLPEGAVSVPVDRGSDDNRDNDVSTDYVDDPAASAQDAATAALSVVDAFATGADAYGVAYTVLDPIDWTRDAGRAVDPGYYVPIVKDLPTPLLPTTGDPMRLAMVLALLGVSAVALLLILVAYKSRKKENDRR